jgi:hypothetical protein
VAIAQDNAHVGAVTVFVYHYNSAKTKIR